MKHISWMITALILMGTMASCGGEDTATSPQTTTEAVAGESSVETEEVFDPFANLPEKDYGGYDFHMLLRSNERWIEDMYVEASTGDIVDDAIFSRNSMIEEKYNVAVTYQASTHDNYETDGVKTILAGDDAYDLIMAHGRAAFSYANQGLVLDWNTDLPYVNLDNPWWDQDARQSLSINHQLYVMIGDLSYCSMGAANLMLFNKQMFQVLDLEYPYQLVKDGKWTYETWESMAKLAASDLNGDGTINKDHDRFGYVTQKWVGPVQAFATSGLRVIEKDAADIPYISIMSDKTQEVFNRYFDMIESDNAYVDTNDLSYSADFIKIFEEGRALFIDMNMHDVEAMRDMDTDFGIVPWPKYDEAAEYCTNVDAGTNMCIVPMTASDPERTSIILEAMGAIGYHKVLPAYYEVALQTKASRDNDSADMLDIIKAARIYDLGYYNSDMSGAYSNEFVDFVKAPNLGRNFASWYEKNEKAANRGLEKVLKEYID